MNDITIGAHTYRLGKLAPLDQWALSKRIARLVPTLAAPCVAMYKEIGKGKSAIDALESLAPMFQPFADSLSTLPDEDLDHVVVKCLSVVKIQREIPQGSGGSQVTWHPVWNREARGPQFDFVTLDVQLRLVFAVIAENLGPFIQGLLMSQRDAAAL